MLEERDAWKVVFKIFRALESIVHIYNLIM